MAHVARICTQFLEAETSQFLHDQHTHLDHVTIEHVWDSLDQRIRERVPVPANIQQLHKAIEEEWTNIHRPQSTTWSTLCEGDVLHCVRQMVVTPDTDWFSDPPGPQKQKCCVYNFGQCIYIYIYIYITVVSSRVVQPTCINGIIGSLKTIACPKKQKNWPFIRWQVEVVKCEIYILWNINLWI